MFRWGVYTSAGVLAVLAAAAAVYTTRAVLVGVLIALFIAMVHQFQALVHDFPGYVANLQGRSARFRELTDRFHLTGKVQDLLASLPGRLGGGLLGFTRRLFGALFSTLTVVVLTMVDKVGSSGLIGGTVLGLIGALMAIPVAAGLKVVLAEQLHARDSADADAEAGGPSADPGERDMRHPPA